MSLRPGRLAQELRLTRRRLARSPGFTAAALLVLVLGIGATVAIYSLVHGVVLSPLPYPQADRLVSVWHSALPAEIPRLGISAGVYLHYRDTNRTLDEIAIYRQRWATLTGIGEPQRIDTAIVSSGFFDLLLGDRASLGRTLRAEDDLPGASPVVVASHGFWIERLGGSPQALGRLLELDGVSHQVVGVLPPGFDFPSTDTDLWVASRLDPATVPLGGFSAQALARLQQGVGPEQARADLESLIPRLSEPYPGPAFDMIVTRGGLSAQVTPLLEERLGGVEQTLWTLLATVGLVLLIACANVANIFLVRAEGRRREVAVRLALGAGRGQLLGGFLSESLVLAGLGGGLGLLSAYLSIEALQRFGRVNLPRLHEVGIDGNVVAVSVGLSVLVGFGIGVLPVLSGRTFRVALSLRPGTRGTTVGRQGHRMRKLLIAAQIAFALLLLSGAGLMARSFWHLRAVEPGFDARSVLSFRLSLPRSEHSLESAAQLHQRLLDRLAELPGVVSVGAVECLPLRNCQSMNPLYLADRSVEPGEIPPAVEIRAVIDGYFETAGIPLLSGRLIQRSDIEHGTRAAVVSGRLAARFWPHQSPLGERVYPDLPGEDPPWYTVVGVVGDVRDRLNAEPPDTIYLAMGDGLPFSASHSLAYTLKTTGAPLDLASTARSAIWEIEPDLPVAEVRSLNEIVSEAEAPMAFTMVLLAIASAVALALGAVGVYGVLSYIVSGRRAEIGVRMALGAASSDVGGLVLREAGRVAAAGIGLGLLGALALTRLMAGLLFGVSPLDPLTLTSASVLLLLVALLASYLPARRASHVSPTEALRSD